MAPKKGQKMGLGEFLADESLGTPSTASWADEMEDMPTVPSDGRTGGTSGYGSRRDYGGSSGGDRFSGYSRADDSDRFQARAQVPVPDRPPFTAHVGNLSFDVTEGEISDFFATCDVSNVRLVRDREQDRPKGFGYVEFNTREGLVAALDLNGSQLAGRNVRISVAEPPKDRGDERFAGEWRRSGPLPSLDPPQRRTYERHDRDEGGGRRQSTFHEGDGKVRDFNNWERKGPLSPLAATSPTSSDRPRGEREFRRRSPAPNADGDRSERQGFRERPQVERQPSAAERDNEWRRSARPDAPQRSTPVSPVLAQVRPKLELKKRSEQPAAADTPVTPSDKPNPFGAARPIDTTQKEKEIEERRAAQLAARKAREEREREEKKAAQEKASEPGTPTAPKSMELRRGSGSTHGGEGEEHQQPSQSSQHKDRLQDKKRTDKPQPKSPENWRARASPKEQQPKQEGESDGWSTVKRGGRGGKPVSAS
jgi:translation initiation factor 4B